ncbi:MAG: DHH family phosphoesterase [Bacteroidetes bacterium]|nr:DHH family phosphoesterase [Bacteroidota bacterium]
MLPIQDVLPLLQTPRRIFITTHHKPDGDAIGSIMALYHYLTAKGHKATPVITSEMPDFLTWMPGAEDHIINYEAESKKAEAALNDAEIIFGLDFNDFSRTKHLEQQLANASQPKVLIDHHLFPKPVWDYGISIPDKSSTCEMVYDFINLCEDNALISVPMAECLYTGVMTDTGSFRFPVTTSAVHLMVADLISKGLEHSHIHEKVYDSWSIKRMQFLGYVLLEKMEIFPKYNAGLICLTRKDLKLFEVTTGDTEGLVNYPLSIGSVRFATLITERSDEVKLSFRSKGDFDVSDFARKHFNGGGHFNASGGRSTSSFLDTVSYFKQILSDIHPR